MKSISPGEPCFLCPRRCGARRESSVHGYCGEGAALRLACASIHRGEEPPLTGAGENGPGGGSGTIFVSGCNLGCVFCQNYQISDARRRLGRITDSAEFARICLALQKKGAENINIVTGSHAVPALAEGIAAAKADGLFLPVLWNSSAYELPETLELLEDTVDVFLPDMKTLDSAIAGRYFNAPDYPAAAPAAVQKMLEMRPLRFKEQNGSPARLVSGVMVRHLVLPGRLPASRTVLRWFADHCAGRALLSLMFQYTPPLHDGMAYSAGPQSGIAGGGGAGESPYGFPPDIAPVHGGALQGKPPQRYITRSEYETVLGWLNEFGVEDGFCQKYTPGSADWLPDFEQINPFPSDLSVPVWHWKRGFIP